MTTVTPIRPDPPEPPPIDPRLAQAIDAARQRLLETMCIVSVQAASFSYDVKVGEPEHRQVLDVIYRQLDAIAGALEPYELEAAVKAPASGQEAGGVA